MMENEKIPEKKHLICIHCCGPVGPSNDNNDRFQRSSPSISNSKYYVMKALSSVFKLNYLEPFEDLEWHQKEDDETLLCVKCTDVLADLYQLYQDFLQLGQLDSVLSQKLDRLDEIIYCHERKIINCDLIKISKTEGRRDKNEAREHSQQPTLTRANRELCPKELNVILTRLSENELATTTTTTHEQIEFDDSPLDEDSDDADYKPEWLEIKLEDDDSETSELKTKAAEELVKLENTSEKSLRTVASNNVEKMAGKFNKRTRRNPDERCSPKISGSSSTTTRSRPNSIQRTKVTEKSSKHITNIIAFLEKKISKYMTLKSKFPNPCWYCQRTDFTTPADCFQHTMEKHFSTMHNMQEKPSMSVCTRCSKICSSQDNLTDHLKWCESIPSGLISRQQFQCTVCSKSCSTNTLLRRHMPVHRDDRPFSCDQCTYTSKHQSALYTHQKYGHRSSNEGLQCDQCESYCKNELSLRAHKKVMHTVEGYKKYKEREKKRKEAKQKEARKPPASTVCTECGVDLYHRLALINHRMTVHGDIMGRHLTCDACGRSFRQKYELDGHIKTVHSDARPFVCEICGKTFKRIHTLNCHVDQTHTEEGRLKYNEKSRERIRRRKLLASQLESIAVAGQSGQFSGGPSNSKECPENVEDTPPEK